VTLAIRSKINYKIHYYHGIFREIEQQERKNDLAYYSAVMVLSH